MAAEIFDEVGTICFAHAGTKVFEEGECWYNWGVFNRPLTDEECEEVANYLCPEYRGPGRYFSNGASIRVGKYRTLVTERCGLDV